MNERDMPWWMVVIDLLVLPIIKDYRAYLKKELNGIEK
jgi:hypothetical protein